MNAPEQECHQIIDTVAAHYGVMKEDILGKDRRAEFVKARHISIFLCRHFAELTQVQLKRMFLIDHSSVNYALKMVARGIKDGRSTARAIVKLKAQLEAKFSGHNSTQPMDSYSVENSARDSESINKVPA